jgi:hypothetical protein
MRKTWWLVGGMVVVAVVVAVLIAIAPRPPDSAGEVVAAYDAAPRTGDPEYPSAADLGFDPASLRFAGEADGRSFWLARDDQAQACIVVFIEASELGGGSCASVAILRDRGLTLGVEGFGDSIVAHLVADDVDVDAAPAMWTIIGDNILVAEGADLEGIETLELPRQGGPDIVLRN